MFLDFPSFKGKLFSFVFFKYPSLSLSLSLSLSTASRLLRSSFQDSASLLLFFLCFFFLLLANFILLTIIHIFIIKPIFHFIYLFVKRAFFDHFCASLTDIFNYSYIFIFLHFNYIFIFSFLYAAIRAKNRISLMFGYSILIILTLFLSHKLIITSPQLLHYFVWHF